MFTLRSRSFVDRRTGQVQGNNGPRHTPDYILLLSYQTQNRRSRWLVSLFSLELHGESHHPRFGYLPKAQTLSLSKYY